MQTPPVHDLLTPTLVAEDNVTEFRAPWNPRSLVMLAFFFGPLAGGGLLVLNFPRLGMDRRLRGALALVMAATVALAFASVWLWNEPALGGASHGVSTLVARGGSVLVAWWLASQQRRRYRAFQMSHSPGGKLVLPAIAAALVSSAVEFALRILFLVFLIQPV